VEFRVLPAVSPERWLRKEEVSQPLLLQEGHRLSSSPCPILQDQRSSSSSRNSILKGNNRRCSSNSRSHRIRR